MDGVSLRFSWPKACDKAYAAGYAIPQASMDDPYYRFKDIDYRMPKELDEAMPRYEAVFISDNYKEVKIPLVKWSDLLRVLSND